MARGATAWSGLGPRTIEQIGPAIKRTAMLTYFSAEISVKGKIYDDPATKVLPNHRARVQATK
jgi:hypothetical protein